MADPFFKDLAFAALAQTARNPTRDFLQATPRNPILGYLSDLAASSYSPERTQQMQGVAKFMSAPAISETLDRLSYGEPLTTGAGGLGGTTRIRPEALEAAMTVAPMVGPAGRAAGAGAMAAGRAGERFAERAVPQIMERGGMGAEMLQGMSRGTVSPLDVYHGTPHKFDRFDASKIGTGEGAQVYGHGLYFAEVPAVADEYAGRLSEKVVDLKGFTPNEIHQKILDHLSVQANRTQYGHFRPFVALQNIINHGSETDKVAAKQMEAASGFLGRNFSVKDTGSLYKVDLPDEQIAKMLDWDKPLNEQSSYVQAAIKASDHPMMQYWAKKSVENPAYNGADLLKRLAGEKGDRVNASKLLRQAGIPGIKYLDQGSRQPGVASMTQAQLDKLTRNFVIFPGEEKNLTILERNNQPVQQAMNEFEQSLINFMATPTK